MENTTGLVSERVAENVRYHRQSQEMTLADLAERVSEVRGQPVSLNTISKIEGNKRGIDVDDLVHLAEALDLEPVQLLADGRMTLELELLLAMGGWKGTNRQLADLEAQVAVYQELRTADGQRVEEIIVRARQVDKELARKMVRQCIADGFTRPDGPWPRSDRPEHEDEA